MKHVLQGPGPGRPLGIRNKVSKRFLEDVYESWQKHGRDALEYLGKRKPVEFARLVAGVLPKELIFESVTDTTSVEDLDVIISTLRQHLLSKPGEPLLIEGEAIHEPDRSPAGATESDAGTSGSPQAATPRRR
jgi:hypothetical protein